jgi:L-fucose isomerase-like protein
MTVRFEYIPVFSELLDPGTLERILAGYSVVLGNIGGEQKNPEETDATKPILYFVLTGGTEQSVITLYAKDRIAQPNHPALLLAHPGNNSLPAALEVLAYLQQQGHQGQILYLKGPQDKEGLAQIREAVRNVDVQLRLWATRIGLVGPPSDWLVASSPEPAVVRRTWGPTVVAIPVEELLAVLESVPQQAIQSVRADLAATGVPLEEPSPGELEDAVRVYHALKQLVERERLHALALRCFDLIGHERTTGCFALSQLTDEGIVAGCEGDLVSTLGMLWTHTLLGETPWMANPAQIDLANNVLWLAHCTVPRRLVECYRLRSHFESGLDVAIEGHIPAGPVTLLRIGGRELDRLWLAEGEILRSGTEENLCRTQVEIRLKATKKLQELLAAPLGNHVVLVRGQHTEALYNWWASFRGCNAFTTGSY